MCDRLVTRRALFPRDLEIRRHPPTRRGYTVFMQSRREIYGAAIQLATLLSAAAALVAFVLDAVGDVSTTRMVALVAVVGFSSSWVHTGRVARALDVRSADQVTTRPV
jgi:hypothetical protein